MSVKLRLTRMGRKKRPFYRIVATDSRTRRDGKYLEKIGTYNPLESPALVDIDKELVLKWLLNGAQPSTTVKNLLKKEGILFEFDLRKRGLTEEQIELEYKKWEVVKQERQKKVEAVAEMKRREEEKNAEEEAKAKAKAEAKAKEEAEAAAAAEAKAAEETEEAAEEAPAEEADASVEKAVEEAPVEEAAAEEVPAEEPAAEEAPAEKSKEEEPAEAADDSSDEEKKAE